MVIFILVVIFLIVTYRKDKTKYIIYTLLAYYIIRLVSFKIGVSVAPIMMHTPSLALFFIFFTDGKYTKYYKACFIWIGVYTFYLLFLTAYNDIDFFRVLSKNYFPIAYMLYAIVIYENIRRNKINLSTCTSFFKIFLIIQIVLCWMQYFFYEFGSFFKIISFEWKGETLSITGNLDDQIDNNLMIGTFIGTSTLAGYLCTASLFYLIAKMQTQITLTDKLLLGCSILTLVFAGIKAPLATYIIMLFIAYIVFNKISMKKIIVALGIAIAAILIFPILSDIGDNFDSKNTFSNSPSRSLNLFTKLSQGTVESETTLSFPISMIPYIAKAPIFGLGLENKGGYYLYLSGKKLGEYSTSDAGLMFIWAEYGLVGLFILLFPFIYSYRLYKRGGMPKKIMLLCLLTLLLQSFVDQGFLHFQLMMTYAFSPILYYNYSIQYSHSNRIVKQSNYQK